MSTSQHRMGSCSYCRFPECSSGRFFSQGLGVSLCRVIRTCTSWLSRTPVSLAHKKIGARVRPVPLRGAAVSRALATLRKHLGFRRALAVRATSWCGRFRRVVCWRFLLSNNTQERGPTGPTPCKMTRPRGTTPANFFPGHSFARKTPERTLK